MAGATFDGQDVEACKHEIFRACDDNGDRVITKKEFVKNALKSTFIRSIL